MEQNGLSFFIEDHPSNLPVKLFQNPSNTFCIERGGRLKQKVDNTYDGQRLITIAHHELCAQVS